MPSVFALITFQPFIKHSSIHLVNIICPNNHKIEMMYSDFRDGVNCSVCIKEKQTSVREIKLLKLKDEPGILSHKKTGAGVEHNPRAGPYRFASVGALASP